MCRQFGCGHALAALGNGLFGFGQGGPLMTNVDCSGNEYDLLSCPYEYRPATCGGYPDAAVICSGRWFLLYYGNQNCAFLPSSHFSPSSFELVLFRCVCGGEHVYYGEGSMILVMLMSYCSHNLSTVAKLVGTSRLTEI